MDRRDFVKKSLGILAATPLIGGLFQTKAQTNATVQDIAFVAEPSIEPPYDPFSSARFNNLVREASAIKSDTNNLIFINRTPIVSYFDDEELIGASMITTETKFFAADVITDENETTVVYDSIKSFEFRSASIPNIKIGQHIGQSTLNRAEKYRKYKESADLKILQEHEQTAAESAIKGVNQRFNQMLVPYMLGRDINAYGIVFKTTNKVAPQIHRKADWTVNPHPLASIRGHLKAVKNKYGVTYDRVTMSSTMLRAIVRNCDNKKVIKAGSTGIKEGIVALGKALKLEIEIYDGTFATRGTDGTLKHIPYLPKDVLLFSNTANDNKKDVFHFGNAVVTESIVSTLFNTNAGNFGGAMVGPIGYYTVEGNLNPPDVKAWAVSRGLPVLVDATAFSSLTVTLPLELIPPDLRANIPAKGFKKHES